MSVRGVVPPGTFSSHLFQRVASFLPKRFTQRQNRCSSRFSSLSESGFIPTIVLYETMLPFIYKVLISFREWLHSYLPEHVSSLIISHECSHLFQRVASFLLGQDNDEFVVELKFSSLSESGFIPTFMDTRIINLTPHASSHLFQRVASFLLSSQRKQRNSSGI